MPTVRSPGNGASRSMRSSARLRKSFANMGVAKADRKRQGFDFVATLRIRVVRGVSAAAARGAVTAGVCRTPASLWNRDDTIEAVSEALRMPAEGAGPTVTPIADGRERVLRRFANMFFEHVFQGECACPRGSLLSAPDAPLLRYLQCVLPVQSFDELFESLTLGQRRNVVPDPPDQR